MNKKIYLFLTLFFGFTSLAFAQNTTLTGSIKDANSGETLVGASVALSGTTTGVTTNVDGNFSIDLLGNKAKLLFSYIGYETITRDVTLNGGTQTLDVTLSPSSSSLDEITVVGSRNASRSVLDSPVPVDVLAVRDLISVVPQVDLNQMMTFVAPSFQSNRQTISDGTDHIDPASLRGLGPDQVLVLVNGKRRHNTALVNVNGTLGRGNVGTDLNTIPAVAIERIEVLRDGAAAQYGSDAIAGVINIVLRKDVNQFSANYMTGVHKEGDGLLNQFNANYGFALGKKGGYINLTGDYTFRGFTNRMEEWTGPIYGATYLGNPNLNPEGAANDEALLTARGLTRSDFNMRVGNSQVANASAMFNMAIPLDNGAEFYAFGGLNYRNGESAGFYRQPSQVNQVVYEIYPNGFLPEIHSSVLDRSLGMGIRGKIKNWSVDFSNTYGKNSFGFRVENSINASLGAASATSFDSGGFAFSQNVTGLSVSRFFPDALKGINVAAGSEFRVDNYQIIAGEEASYTDYDGVTTGKVGGVQVFPGFQPRNELNRFRTNLAGYVDLEVNITEQWMVAVAGRYENYSDFGNTITGKIASRFNITDDYAIRGAISTGFRAPSLHQSFFNTVSTIFVNGVPFEVGTFSNNSRVAGVLGIPKLKQETSINYSVGFTAQPTNNFTFSIDGYIIKVDDRVVLTGQFQGNANAAPGTSDREIFDLLSNVGANRAQFFTNAINTTTRGIDIIATYTWAIGEGKLDASVAANFNETTVDQINVASSLLAGRESTYFDRTNTAVVETGNPRSKINVTLNYKVGKFGAMLRSVRFGEVTTNNNAIVPTLNSFTGELESQDQTFSAKWITDFSISYQLFNNLSLQVGANNIFDVYPDEHTHSANNSFGRFRYSRQATQFGFNGAFYFARASVKF